MNLTPEEHVAQLEKNRTDESLVRRKIAWKSMAATGQEMLDAINLVCEDHSCTPADVEVSMTTCDELVLLVVDEEATARWRRNYMINRCPSDQWK